MKAKDLAKRKRMTSNGILEGSESSKSAGQRTEIESGIQMSGMSLPQKTKSSIHHMAEVCKLGARARKVTGVLPRETLVVSSDMLF